MKKFTFTVYIFSCLSLISQKQYQFPENFNPAYNFKPELAHKEFIKDQDPKGSNVAVDKYIATELYAEQFKFDNNDIYLEWDLTKYVRKIFDTIVPGGQEKQNVDIFLERSANNNAYISRFGNMYLNIGMISEAKNEAALAHLIAHMYAHYLYRHISDEKKIFKNDEMYYGDLDKFMELEDKFSIQHQKFEKQAGSFSSKCLEAKNINMTHLWCSRHLSLSGKINQYCVYYDYMIDTSSANHNYKMIVTKSKLPIDTVNYIKQTNIKPRNFFIDSNYFYKLKKIAGEETKKIAYEKCGYLASLNFAFIDYLYDPKNVKNLYYIIESLRRKMYIDYKIRDKGFMADDISDPKISKYNKSILYKPTDCFFNYSQYLELKGHPFFTSNNKPFNTYEEAFIYFSNHAIKLGLNEANFSKALYYFSINKTDSTRKYLLEYQKKNGLYADMANDMLLKGKPFIQDGKTFILYDNVSNKTGEDMNYYLTLKRKKYNEDIRIDLGKDSNKVKLLIMNELLGNKPRELNQMERLSNSLITLFDQNDIEVCKKIKLNSKPDLGYKDIATKFKKSFLIYAPEFYGWFKENNCSKLLYLKESYVYNGYLNEEEFSNNYIGYYIDVNQDRPYFKVPYRSKAKRKDSESNIRKEILSFLYE